MLRGSVPQERLPGTAAAERWFMESRARRMGCEEFCRHARQSPAANQANPDRPGAPIDGIGAERIFAQAHGCHGPDLAPVSLVGTNHGPKVVFRSMVQTFNIKIILHDGEWHRVAPSADKPGVDTSLASLTGVLRQPGTRMDSHGCTLIQNFERTRTALCIRVLPEVSACSNVNETSS
ncbi:hypothetical protein L227DRAFT_112722 [Lentinus tigrinus ALCF2SS1-6]|uniref:Uncharacterized protein n=1 Tax=Lentinus tigrinus ALCF2SS1-6 TaxID=1328759 RepID=A0A5C2S945_9APHY|nr:hypothetical protein L227DRAFT_112722 [Lentinus tigrinus ALCF2SS1-6]